MLPSVADVDWTKLSPTGRETLEKIALPVSDGKTYEEVGEQLGLSRRDVAARIDELKDEVAALAGGAALPDLSQEEYEALRDDIALHGQLVPILHDRRGHVVDGKHRMRACTELGLKPFVHTLDLEGEEAAAIAIAVNLARRHLTTTQKRKIVEAELIRDPERSDRAIAAQLGVSHRTVAAARADLVARGAVDNLSTRRGRDGVAQPAAKPEREPRPNERKLLQLKTAGDVALPKQLVGRWIRVQAFRIDELAPGMYEISTRGGDDA